MSVFELCRTIPANHPSLPGHFPGAPIVPGVVILDEVGAAVAEWRDGAQLTTINVVKFLAPLAPDQPFTIRLSAAAETDGDVDFSCHIGDQMMVQGRLMVRRRAS